MLVLKYLNDEENNYEIEFRKLSKNVVEITGDFQVQTNGFTLSRIGKTDDWDYSKFTTVYKELENGCQFSNDGTVYTEPEVPEPVQPTEEQLQEALRLNKQQKVYESKRLLATYLEDHPLISNCHGGTDAVYTVTNEKQTLMTSNYMTYTIQKQMGEDPILTWNASGCECEVWTEEEYIALILQVSEYVKPLVSKQQKYEAQINQCTSLEELSLLEIRFDEDSSAEVTEE